MKKLLGIVISLALVLGMALPAMAQGSITPSSVDVTISPGGSLNITKTVQTPLVPPSLDIVFLADTTGSMESALNTMKTNIGTIMSTVLSHSPSAAFGVASYRDIGDMYLYQLEQPVTTNTALVTAAINSWFADGGGDTPEAQLNALFELSTNPLTGWRPPYNMQNRFIVWFGDNPGHDPSNGHSLADVITILKNGPYATPHVYAIPVTTPDCDGLDSTGQATAIAGATGGAVMTAALPEDVANAIISALTTLKVTVSMTSDAASPIGTSFSPTSFNVTSGATVVFTETISVSPSAAGGIYTAKDWVLINGEPMTDAAGAIIYENKIIRVPNNSTPLRPNVGGEIFPVDKPMVLTFWGGLLAVVTITVTIAVSAILLKRRKNERAQ